MERKKKVPAPDGSTVDGTILNYQSQENWNEYLLSLFLSTSKAQTMPILVAAMNAGERGVQWWTMAVVITVMIVPVVLMALVLQRFIARGILLGAVKG